MVDSLISSHKRTSFNNYRFDGPPRKRQQERRTGKGLACKWSITYRLVQKEKGLVMAITADTVTVSNPTESPFAPDSPWHRCYIHFLQWLYNKSQSRATVLNYRGTLSHFFAASANDGPPKPPEAYTREDVLYFLHRPSQGRVHHGLLPTPGTINVRLTHIGSFYRFASTYTITTAEGIQPLYDRASPTVGLKHGRVDQKYRALSLEELQRLFAVIPRDSVQGLRDRAVYLFYLHTARRRTEIENLKWGNIEQGTIVDADGTRRSGWLYRFRGKGRRTIDDICELPMPAKEALDAYLEASGRLATMQPDSPLFVAYGKRQRHERPLRASVFEYHLKQYASQAGLRPQGISLHAFRHTAAHERFSAGEDIRSIQRLLRHSNISITDRYIQLLQGTADPGAKLVAAKFAGL